jgi:hypothetical protein
MEDVEPIYISDELIPQRLTTEDRTKLLDALKKSIVEVVALQEEIPDKVKANAIFSKLERDTITKLAGIAYRKKQTSLSVLYSDIQESGDDDSKSIQEEIVVAVKELNSFKAKLSRSLVPSQDNVKMLADLEQGVNSLKLKLVNRQKKTITMLTAAELKGEEELDDIRDNERSDIRRSTIKQKNYVEALDKEIEDEIAYIKKESEKKGIYFPDITLDVNKNIVLPTILTENGITIIDKSIVPEDPWFDESL